MSKGIYTVVNEDDAYVIDLDSDHSVPGDAREWIDELIKGYDEPHYRTDYDDPLMLSFICDGPGPKQKVLGIVWRDPVRGFCGINLRTDN